MECPACGADDRQKHIAQLWDRPQVIYHCLACDRCYGTPAHDGAVSSLTKDELGLLKMTAAGWLNKQIANQMGIGLRTVHIRRRLAMDKLGIKTRSELMRKAVELGLCD